MPTFISPRVNVQEIDLSTTIPAVATSIAVLVLRNTWMGPEMTQEFVTNENQLISTFGKPRKRLYDSFGDNEIVSSCYEDMFSGIGYLKYGTSLYCTRVMPSDSTFAGINLSSADTWTANLSPYTLNTSTVSGDITNPDDFHEEDTLLGTDQVQFIAKSRGYWGNQVKIAVVDYTTQKLVSNGTLNRDNNGDLILYDSDGLSATDGTYYKYASANNTAYITTDVTISVVLNNVIADLDNPLESGNALIIVQAKEQGGTTYDVVEVNNVSMYETAVDDQGQSQYIENYINNNSEYIRVMVADAYKNASLDADWVTYEFKQFSGGCDFTESSTVSDALIIEGYNLYNNPEEIDVNLFIDGNKSETVKAELIVICESRIDSMCVLDCKYAQVIKNKGSEATDIVNWRKGLSDPGFNQNTSYAALYGNWFNVFDKYMNEYHWVPASGYMAGLFARTDDLRDPWFAPAGLNRTVVTGVRKIAWNPTLGERDLLYKNGINPIVSFAGQGKVVWGQKTMLDKQSAFNRINVRRLFMVLEKAISTSAKYFLFEPNDRFTRAQLIAMINPFLRDVVSRRGIYEFYVQCDDVNNTPERIDRNELWVSIFIKPTRAAEFINLQFIATKTGASFEELIGTV